MQWVLCPICKNKTRLKIREDTILKNFSADNKQKPDLLLSAFSLITQHSAGRRKKKKAFFHSIVLHLHAKFLIQM